MRYSEKPCKTCDATSQPWSGRQLHCDDCRSVLTLVPAPTTPKGRAAKPCEWCDTPFTPRSSSQRRCDPCRQAPPATLGRCACGSTISGRARWGDRWGGECDRAEERVAELLSRWDAVSAP